MENVTKTEEFLKELFEENNNMLECYAGYPTDGKILIYSETKKEENLTLHVIGKSSYKICTS